MEVHCTMPAQAWHGPHGTSPALLGEPATAPVLHLLPVHALQDGRLRAVSGILPASPRSWAQRVASPARDTAGMLQEACAELRYWHQSRGPVTTLLAPLRLRCGPALVELVEAALEDCRIAPFLLDLGLDCRSLADGEPGVETILAASALRDLGAGLVLDHVSRPDAACALLRRLPFTALRLHTGVAAGLATDRGRREAVGGLVQVAHGQGVTVIASGIGTALERRVVADLGFDLAQGPLFGPSVEAALFRRIVAARQ